MTITIYPVAGLPPVNEGDDVAALVADALAPLGPVQGDVVIVTHKVISKAEGAVRRIQGDEAEFRLALVEEQSVSILRRRGPLIIAETSHGFVCANAGVDRSNAEPGSMILLPEDPDRSAHRLRKRLQAVFDIDLPVVITDTFGRPWRRGLTDVAIGVSGLEAIVDLAGTPDWAGRELEVTEIAVADELAAAADLVMGKALGIPVVLVRGFEGARGPGRASDLVRPIDEELFR